MTYRGVAILVALLMLTGCTITFPSVATPGATPGSTVPSNGDEPLAGTSWALTGLGRDAAIPVVANSTVTLDFSTDGQASGNAGCNSYGGDYTVAGEMITISELVSTLMACTDTAVMDQEQEYLAALDSAGHFAVDGNQLTIWGEGDSGTLTFTTGTAATAVPTDAAVTATPVVPLTPLPTVPPEPTTDGNTDPGDYPPSEPTRVNFGAGETSANVDGNLAAGERAYYVLAAQEGQNMSIAITSLNNDVLLAVVGEDGTPYKRYESGGPSWSFTLPATQDYYIEAVSVGVATAYTVHVSIAPLDDGNAERMEFAPGVTSAERSGLLPSGLGTLQYVLTANEGQTMTVDATSDGTPLSMTIADPTGFSMIPEMREVEGGYAIGAQYTLPATGDYVVTLQKGDHTPSTNYTVSFTIQ